MSPKLIYGVLIGFAFILFLKLKWRRELRQEEMRKKDKEFQRKMAFNAEYKKGERCLPATNNDDFKEDPPPKLSTQFMYNGHAWDALEVLGLTTDFSEEDLEEALKKALEDVDEESHSFFQHAYETLKKG